MAVQVKAKGNAPATGMPRTPAPDEITNVRAPTAAGYGENGPTNNSPSVPPSKRVVSPLGLSMEGDIVDPVKSQIISGGTAKPAPDWQTRDVSSKPLPPAHGMRSRTANGGSLGDKVPNK
jgi:hypothetical protein